MGKIITVDDINSSKFYQLPKAFFHNPLYKDMKNESKIAYSILRDLLDLSIKNNWINEKNQIYVKLSRNKLMHYLNIKGTQKITQIMNELKNKGLIVEKQIGISKCNEIYLCNPDELNVLYSDQSLLENQENIKSFENQKSRPLKIKAKSFENQTQINTNSTETNLEEEEEVLVSYKEVKNRYLNYKEKIKLKELLQLYPKDLILKAIDVMVTDAEKTTLKYIQKLLEDWTAKGILTVEEVDKMRLEWQRKKSSKKANWGNVKKPNEKKSTFDNFKQRNYNFGNLEDMLLGNMEYDSEKLKE